MQIYCVGCEKEVEAKLVTGKVVYRRLPHLWKLPFWLCKCGGYVGCHHKTNNPTKPLGVIPTAELRKLRQQIHAELDPIWRTGFMSRTEVYTHMKRALCTGKTFHVAYLRSEEEAEEALQAAAKLNAKFFSELSSECSDETQPN